MKKIIQDQIQGQTLIDLRSQKEFQKGHIKGALNLNPKNLGKYGKAFLKKGEELVLVVSEENNVEIAALVEESGLENVFGYLIAEEVTDQETIQTITAEEFMVLEGDFLLLDVRHPDEITRPAPQMNLVSIPLEDLSEKYKELAAKQPIYTLCGSGNRATAAASFLTDKGYQTIVIEGGMGAVEAVSSED